MNLSRPFIHRPVATLLLMAAIVLCGALAYALLPVAALPEVAFPTIQVVTQYPGATPSTMSATVTAPLERRFGQMPGLQQMNSTSSEGQSVITLQFSLDLPLDIAEQEVQQAINAAQKLLPPGLAQPPIYSKINPADAPILSLALHSDTLPLTDVQDIAETRLAQKLSQVGGIGLVSVSGGQRKAIVIEARGATLAGMNRSLETIRTAVGRANQNLPKGSVDLQAQTFSIGGNDQLNRPSDYRDLIIDYSDARSLQMSSVARVAYGPENARQGAWSNGKPAIVLDIRRQPGANVIKAVDRVRSLLPSLQASLPPGIKVDILADRTKAIRASVHDVQTELVLAVALVVMVVFLFLRNLPATLIPALSVPITLVGTLAVIHALGFSLNNLTLMALTIATGFVVDDAIVVLENIIRHVEDGEDSTGAATRGSKEIGFTIVSLSLSLIAVMIPLLFMDGILGRLFREFAMTLSVAVVVSAVVSLVLTPMLCARLLHRMRDTEPHQGLAWLYRLERAYGRVLARVLAHPVAVMLSVALTAGASAGVLYAMPKGLFPTQYTDVLQGVTVAAPTVSFETMAQMQQAVAARLYQDPAVKQVTSFVGIDPANASLNQGRLLVELKPAALRDPGDKVSARLLRLAGAEPGIRLYLRPQQDLALDTQDGATAYRIGMQAMQPDKLEHAREQLIRGLRNDAMFSDVVSQSSQEGLQITLDFDRATAARLGVTQQQISDALYDAFGARQISTIYSQLNQYHVVLKAAEAPADVAHLLDSVFVQTGAGSSAPLSAMVSANVDTAPLVISRQNQFPYTDISFNLSGGAALDTGLAHLASLRRQLELPVDVDLALEGVTRTFEASLHNGVLLVMAAVIVVYILMGVLYESFIHPLTILSTLPAAALGALAALWMCRLQFDVIGLIGIVLLVGIVMKNAIMMIDFALTQERELGLSPVEAITAAAELRFRPILMTSVASLAGALPLAFGTGAGAELRHPLGIAIIGGLIVSQMLTLFSTPVIYLVLHRAGTAVSRRLRGVGLSSQES